MRVCQEWFPETDGFYMDGYLAEQIEVYAKNVVKDWDFVIIISGSGRTRVGKSVLAIQICMYWTYLIWKLHKIKLPFDVSNIVFNGAELIKRGNFLGMNLRYSALLFDEAGSDLESTKVMRRETKAIKDFLRECGQWNLLTVIVHPEFFDLPKPIAMNRSHCLIDVSYIPDENGYFERGFFNYFSIPNKKNLYINGKKYLDYKKAPSDFNGRFFNFYPINEEEYRAKKREALKKREEMGSREQKMKSYLIAFTKYLYNNKLTYQEISDIAKDNGVINPNNKYIERLLKAGH